MMILLISLKNNKEISEKVFSASQVESTLTLHCLRQKYAALFATGTSVVLHCVRQTITVSCIYVGFRCVPILRRTVCDVTESSAFLIEFAATVIRNLDILDGPSKSFVNCSVWPVFDTL
jgi:hypothetical protein